MTNPTPTERLRALRRRFSPKRIYRRAHRLWTTGPDDVLRQAKGIIHVGANVGQERDTYADFRLPVVWIEPLPDVFDQLERNIRPYKNQRAFRYLLAEDRSAKTLHVANNRGASSSILDFKDHKAMFPDIAYVGAVEMNSVTLPDVIEREAIDLNHYDALLLDTQGSELMILRGSSAILPRFRFVQVEAPDFEAYAGCPLAHDIIAFMESYGFRAPPLVPLGPSNGLGHYYELQFVRS